MKKSILLATLVFCFSLLHAQNELMVHSSDKGLYLSHSVAPKESFYSIGRLYNIPPKDIAAFNGLDMNNGLNIGQTLHVPLVSGNFSQTTANGRPVYYMVDAKEGLYRVSVKNNDVKMADLRKWNKLTSDNISTGQLLVIGYLISPEANNIVVAPVEKKVEVNGEDKMEIAHINQEGFKEDDKQEVTKTEGKREEEAIKEVKKPEPPVTKTVNNPVAIIDGSGGYFKSHFELQVKSHPVKRDETASAGIFKTASGWQDGKYYALMDGVETGMIIKVVNPTNGKSIYAKVLGEMSGIRQNVGYDVRISNAAASALEVSDTEKFIVKVTH